MKRHSVRSQAAVLTAANALVRALGFALRIALSRMLGAEAVGVMELAHSAHMLSVAPVTAGLPAAVSRLTARGSGGAALASGRELALRLSAILMPLWVVLAPALAWLLGDMRTLPALWVFTPCIAVLGVSAAVNGYCYGSGSAWMPALSELTEQAARFAFAAALLTLPGLSVAWRAAAPGAAALAAESCGLLLTLRLMRRGGYAPGRGEKSVRREIVRLAAPLTASRFLAALMSGAAGALLPRRLMASGLTLSQAMSGVGMLHGMVMPVLFAPGIFTSALSMVGAPAVARCEGARLRRVALKLLGVSLACGLAGMLAIRLFAPFLAGTLYRLPALTPVFVAASPLTLLFALQQAAHTLLCGLGEQKKTLLPALAGAALTLPLLYCLPALPGLRLTGALYAMLMGRALTVLGLFAPLLTTLRATARADFAAPSDD